VSRRSQHLRRRLLKDREAWNAYCSEAVEKERRFTFPPEKKGGANP